MRGTLAAQVNPQPRRWAMEVLTQHARARVLGTRFTVSTTPFATRLDVEAGSVELRHMESGRKITVGEGQFGTASRGALLTLAEATPAPIERASAEDRALFEEIAPRILAAGRRRPLLLAEFADVECSPCSSGHARSAGGVLS